MISRSGGPRRHLTEGTLLAYASGTLGVAHRLVVEMHEKRCARCHEKILEFENAGGLLIDQLPPMELLPDALQRFFKKVETLEVSGVFPVKENRFPPQVGGVVLPQALSDVSPGRLRWLAPGIRHATLLRDECGSLHFIRVKSGVGLPRHTHTGLELTYVLQGSFHDDGARYFMGDVAEESAQDDAAEGHIVAADPPDECICIIAISGRLHFKGLLGRLMRPVIPF